jgi:imidazolonepropionase
VFGGNRSGEFEQRLQGVSYAEIAAQGGGIASTVRAPARPAKTNCSPAPPQAPEKPDARWRDHVEIKSGYGLDLANERKMLRVARRLGAELPVSVRSTCLAAHALPPEYKDRADDYIDHICAEMLPLAAEGLVDAVDAFCEYLAFSPAQVERCSSPPGTGPAGESCMPSNCRRCTVRAWRRVTRRCPPITWSS